jgi:hydrogenase maturation factor
LKQSVSKGDYVLTYAGQIVQLLSMGEAEENLGLLAQVERGAPNP